ncbi:MAG: hypothetical protein BWX89_01026 [candidate division TA06 bacterium ADurb.Bin131]|uniref:Methyltransferase FkbM domain-containing protein n=1 Tax=candidate division TA06 bacterium ADurb.Bin131 TaxID=1852827 RepID=A0A1V6C8Q3_UNCT6|nr:MAG: hypothetical protein BWX89_01026 [candidate division TA06 bacterium ADurb.Bin131]
MFMYMTLKKISKKTKSFIRSVPVMGNFIIHSREKFRSIKPGGPYWTYNFKAKQFHKLVKKISHLMPNDTYSIMINKNKQTFIVLQNGLKFFWDPKNTLSLLGMPLRGNYEPDCTFLVERLIKNGDTVFDIGGNFGWYTCYFAKYVGDNGKVYTFEPTDTVMELEKNVLLNGYSDRVVINRAACGNEEGFTKLFVPSKLGTAFASLRPHPYEDNQRFYQIEVPIRKLDDYCKLNHVEKIDFIKLDIEGGELLALKGAEKVLREISPIILLEIQQYHTKLFGYMPVDLLYYLEGFGYTVFEIDSKEFGVLKQLKDFDQSSNINFLAVKNISVIKQCGLTIKNK